MKSLFKTVALITFFSVLTRIIGFFFRIYLSRVVGAEGLGMYQVASSIFFVLMTVVASGLPLIISRMGAGFRAKKEEKNEKSLISTALIFALALSIILCLFVLLFRGLFAKMFTDQRCVEILIVMLPSLIFSAVYSVFRGALWGQGNYFALCVTELFEQVFRIFVCVLMLGATLSAIENALNVGWSMTFNAYNRNSCCRQFYSTAYCTYHPCEIDSDRLHKFASACHVWCCGRDDYATSICANNNYWISFHRAYTRSKHSRGTRR